MSRGLGDVYKRQGIAEAHSFLDLEGSFSVTWKGTTSAYAFVSPGGDDGCDFQELGVTE